MERLFETNTAIFKALGSRSDKCGEMVDHLEKKLLAKGFTRVLAAYFLKPSVGTHNDPILSGTFRCKEGTAKVTCVYRNGTKKKPHWAVYVKKIGGN